jgi:Flp pilus assembly pilin Flp
MTQFLTRFLTRFRRDDAGAVTVDWVVLTAGVTTAIFLIFVAVKDDAISLSGGVQGYMSSQKMP